MLLPPRKRAPCSFLVPFMKPMFILLNNIRTMVRFIIIIKSSRQYIHSIEYNKSLTLRIAIKLSTTTTHFTLNCHSLPERRRPSRALPLFGRLSRMTREIPQIFIPMRYRPNWRLRNMHKFKQTELYKEKGVDAHIPVTLSEKLEGEMVANNAAR